MNNSTNATESSCGICMNPFVVDNTSLDATLLLPPLPFSPSTGLFLECPSKHGYCLDCLTEYVIRQAEETDQESAFSVRCPGCPGNDPWRIDDATAQKILPVDVFDVLQNRKLISGIPKVRADWPTASANWLELTIVLCSSTALTQPVRPQ